MNAIAYLDKQLANINTLLHGIAGDLTAAEWLARPAPGQNRLGFTVWHIPRIQDTIVQAWIRGIPEIAHQDRWAAWHSLRPLGNGVGIPLADADRLAHEVQPADVMAYADAVHEANAAWLKSLSDEALDQVPDVARNLAPYPEYHTPGFVEEVKGLYAQPIWSLLMRPCIGHVHRHLGEIEVIKAILRGNGADPAP